MNIHRWIVWLAVGSTLLVSCANSGPHPVSPVVTGTCDPCPTKEPELAATCDLTKGTTAVAPRERGWVLFQIPDAEVASAAASDVMKLADDGQKGENYVIVRADVVVDISEPGNPKMSLVIPVDAAADMLNSVVAKLAALKSLEGSPPTVLRVEAYLPSVPHQASTFITPGEYEKLSLPEYCPPGRHPGSPGANPWG